MINRLNLYDLDGNKINIEALGLFGLNLTIPSPSYSIETQKIDGGGTIVLDKQLNPRSLTADFMTVANTYEDFLKQKFELFSLLGSGKEFYIEQAHRKGIVWKCYLDSWEPETIGMSVSTFSVPLTCLQGYSQTINLVKKTFNNLNTFTFKNEGNVIIDSRKHSETTITFSGASSNLTITNNTNGNSFKYYGTTQDWDTITLQGITSYKNFSSIFVDTNKKILTFNADRNDFTLSGVTGSSFELEISTRFYFL